MGMYLDTPLFGVSISIIAFFIGIYINKKTNKGILNPLIVSSIIIIGFLLYFDIDYEIYNKGGSMISFFIAPATVVLAVPLYKNIRLLKGKWFNVLTGITLGSLAGLFSIYILSKLFKIEATVMISLFPKSTTAAISMEIAEHIGGIPALALAFTVLTGNIGYFMAEYIFKWFNIEDKMSKGLALGTTAHVLGTAKAMELGETEGALSSLAITVAGIVSVFLIPWFMKLLSL
ncbi:MAG: LrgB family protein [Tissierellia bacterium]|nr:LrgB family protein [Tissierellia bacterium]